MYELSAIDHLVVPNIPVGTGGAGVLEEMDVSLASAAHGEYVALRRLTVKRIYFVVTGQVIGGTPTVVFKKRPTPLSATDESTIGTLALPDLTAVGKVVFKTVTSIELDAGQSIQISWTQGTAGQGHARMEIEPHTESFANQSNMIEDKT